MGKVIPIEITEEMRQSYLDYAMSVIVGRALPDVRDGLKPVHRRILYAMHTLGMTPDRPHRKSAYIVGEVLARYHPHGDAPVYDALVRLAQDFACRYPLVDGHGNFGSIDGDAPAAMRYTEARLSRYALEMLRDINKDTVDFVPNYDGTTQEPAVLPSRLPNLLVNGSAGIAVGMATNIPPHNLGEVIDGLLALIDNPDLSLEELMRYVPGPDFPTGGIILGREGIRTAYATGRGGIVVRGKATIERKGNRNLIVITEIPYQVNKARLLERIAELVKEKRLEGVADLRDESDRSGIRVVVELKRDADPQVILNRLYKHTQLEETFGVIMLALVNGQPEVLSLKEMMRHYLNHQKEVVVRRCQYELREAQLRLEVVEGLVVAVDNIDAVVQLIKTAPDVPTAKERLISTFGLTEKQAQAILDMRLQRLTALEREKLVAELKELKEKIAYLEGVLADEAKVWGIVKEELKALKERFADPRRTLIVDEEVTYRPEDLIPAEQVVVLLSHQGYIKRQDKSLYRSQHRGGRGVTGLKLKDGDFVRHLYLANTHDYLLFFTSAGRVHRLKVYEIPEAERAGRGTALPNLLQLSPEEQVTAIIPVADFSEDKYVLLVTRQGVVKKLPLGELANIRRVGLNAISLDPGDELVAAALPGPEEEVLLVTEGGKAIRFRAAEVRPMGRAARGVRGMKLRPGDRVAGLAVLDGAGEVLLVTAGGYGKRVKTADFPLQGRGGMGVTALAVSKTSGPVVGVEVVRDEEEILLASAAGWLTRLKVKEVPVMGRQARGVVLMRLQPEDRLVALAKIGED
ncbi:DNA gyrase, A subunit [Ammonifex degensii KC4]|uniref:DNA gyrase subunit A n=1 Tax=Ammonifex degensii (strain DSM 10501 / KC4) TaxID=429009 RepID=C9RA74_AMMDK|nr:DNA gyrase subunit A [Ammonifex degensii]ACX51183.1 DNA gyrase, A subunit [Ammonifex degensii KC4]